MIYEGRIAMTEAELSAFAQKLDAWAQTLPGKERAFLQQMLADASDAANEDISGYANLSSLLNDDVAGFADFGPGGSLIGSVVGYAEGVSRAEAELPIGVFNPADKPAEGRG